ncbi:hypothetical protein BCT61_01950 [Vibrio breoganii]|uniref:Chromosome partitioning protein ParB n=2 Tax=Vibrio breoganii TaxID=553239 RepID=A0AAP8MUP1_9VIBR|nr:hypothetical protein [Vibrio breoganii]OCH77429.1 hypothetical protein A6D95_06520 [Vibrio breoganii]PMG90732.1 hypothetical protein BCU80_14145 [Vibrio breoganii]PML19264.1 hypothetical protein BCT84_03860 [Vibrio breoganii]PML30170.1 hypothetical protein BCT82_04670 [Vibrio breoganii]PML35922.1 hypothetical protein BCT78_11220 [Vibrio breoganii]
MRQQYHFRRSIEGQLLIWDVIKLVEMAQVMPVITVPLDAIQELDEAFWYDLGGAKPTCRNVAEHAKLIQQTDLNYPIILCDEGRVMDGMHRVCKALMQGATHIKAVQFTTPIAPHFIDLDPETLPY